ncbi:DUF6339 family protein [Fictibacillus sp. KU28468]|uniref:DUF6339 family protein n=1 Tax=Fictibacillus sp. KU28468 TaxID=2991053 RepID=UPI00223D9524|nr:DUF6339 family protein [Fictibacillus sp. KU28468]UZJ78604.1 DUF6339 family protein [Fictibacillus sp. KU28468]
MNNIVLMKAEILNDLKNNIDLSHYKSNDNSEIISVLDLDLESLPFENFLIVSDTNNKSADDFENCKLLYEKFKDIPLSLASEERFWSYLSHTVFWDYMCQRWPVQEAEGDEIEFIKTRFFFSSKGKTFYRNGLSRLWWYAYLTYDDTKTDPYHYTRMMLLNQEIANLLIDTTNLSRNKVALKAVLEVITDFLKLEEFQEIERIKNRRKFIRELIKYTNLVGGVTIWDILSEKEAYAKSWKFVERHIVRLPQESSAQ